jgi:hypothetical protein
VPPKIVFEPINDLIASFARPLIIDGGCILFGFRSFAIIFVSHGIVVVFVGYFFADIALVNGEKE